MFWFHDVYCLLNLIVQTCTKRNFGKGYAETAKFYRGFCGRNRDGKVLVDAVIFYLNMQFPHRSALTFLDRSGLFENHQGGKTGGVTLRMRILNSRVNSGARKSFGRLAQW